MADNFASAQAPIDGSPSAGIPVTGSLAGVGTPATDKLAQTVGTVPPGSVATHQRSTREGSGELFLLFSVASLGQCALPIEAVQVVTSADGPFRSVPGCGGAHSRFLGLVSVRGQVQLLFDLTHLPSERSGSLPALERDEHLVVAVAAGSGQTLALRVTEPLRLVRRQADRAQSAPQGELAALVCGSFAVSEPAGAVVWLLGVDALFEFLGKEVRNG